MELDIIKNESHISYSISMLLTFKQIYLYAQ
jgi:hypothetical protein